MKKNIKNPKMLFMDEQWQENDESFKRYLIVFAWMIILLIPLIIIFYNIETIGG